MLDDDAVLVWNAAYEKTLPLHFAAFDDVVPLLDALDAAGIAYGAVSNNTYGVPASPELNWNVPTVSSLTEILALLGLDGPAGFVPTDEIG